MPTPKANRQGKRVRPNHLYALVSIGELKGKRDFRYLGDNRWLYVPDAENPLTFVRHNGETVVLDERFIFDGGSIPGVVVFLANLVRSGGWRILSRVFRYLTKDYYMPAYAFHDFGYIRQERGDPVHNFEENNLILAEIIKTMQQAEKDGGAEVLQAIYYAVGNPIQRERWDSLAPHIQRPNL